MEVFVTVIKILIGKDCPWFLDRSFLKVWFRGSKGKDIEFWSEHNCAPEIKNLLCSTSKYAMLQCKMQEHYEWNTLRTKCWSIILKIYRDFMLILKRYTLCSKCGNAHCICSKTEMFTADSGQFLINYAACLAALLSIRSIEIHCI